MATAPRFPRLFFFFAGVALLPLGASSAPRAITEEQILAFSSEPSRAALASSHAAAGSLIPGEGHPPADEAHCTLDDPGSDHATSESCTRCHKHRQSHPYDIDYAHVASERRGDYAAAEQVVRAGVLLPDGEIRCVTCHDRRSPWKYKIALPPGAKASPSVAARMRDGTFEAPGAAPDHLAPGSEVTATPLCRVCHQF